MSASVSLDQPAPDRLDLARGWAEAIRARWPEAPEIRVALVGGCPTLWIESLCIGLSEVGGHTILSRWEPVRSGPWWVDVSHRLVSVPVAELLSEVGA